MSLNSSGSRRTDVIRGAAAGALLGLFISLAARGCGEVSIGIGGFRVGGEGWPEGWMRPPWWMLAASGLVLGSIVGLFAFALDRIRTGLMSEFADQLGLHYEPTVEISKLVGSGLFAGRVAASHGFHGEYSGTHVDLVDVEETTTPHTEDARDQTTRRTIAFLPAERFPSFRLEPRGFGNRFAGALGAGISLNDAQPGSTDARSLEQFGSGWFLAIDENAPDCGLGVEVRTMNELAIRRLFTPHLIESLIAFPNLYAQVRAGRLLVWRKEGYLPARLRESLLDDAVELRNLLLEANQTPAKRNDSNANDEPNH